MHTDVHVERRDELPEAAPVPLDAHCALRDRVAAVMAERAGIEVPDVDTDLLDAGLLDSLALVSLIVAFEDTFGIELPLDDFDIDRFRSVTSIADYLASLGAEAVPDR